METITARKSELTKTLQTNKETHKADFEQAWEGFIRKAEENLQQRLKAVKNARKGQKIELWVNMTLPEEHTADYDRALEMLDWHTGEEIEVDEDTFRNLVQDDWSWKDKFETSNKLYTGSASPSKRRKKK